MFVFWKNQGDHFFFEIYWPLVTYGSLDPIKELALLWSSSLSTLRSTYSSITSIKVNLESWSSEYTIFYTPCIPDTYLFSSQYYYLKWISMPHTKYIFLLFWGLFYDLTLLRNVLKKGQSWSSDYTIFYTPCIPDTYLFSSQYY